MDKALLNLVVLAVEGMFVVWFNDRHGGPRFRGPEIYALIVGTFALCLVAASAQKLDASFLSRPSPPPKRFDGVRARGFLRAVLFMTGLSLLYALDSPRSTAAAVGLKVRHPPILAFAAGLSAYLVLLGLFRGVQRIRGRLRPGLRATLRANRFLFPRDRRHFRSVVAAMVLNPFSEEFLFRGVLIHLVGNLSGLWTLPILVGLFVHLVLHAYQGRAGIPWHVAFYCVAVALLLSDLGLWGAFGFHFAGDILPLLLFRGQFDALRRLRAARTFDGATRPAPAVATASTPPGSPRPT